MYNPDIWISSVLVLAIDTVSVLCAVCLFENNRTLVRICENLDKGHAERLMGQISAVMKKGHRNFSDVDRVGVNIGPGSFTGGRIGISAARGLALALNRPVVGISTFEALAFEAVRKYRNQPITVVLEAHRDMLYVQDFDIDNRKICEPRICTREIIISNLSKETVLTGSGARKIAQMTECPLVDTAQTANIETYALLSAQQTGDRLFQAPSPLYLQTSGTRKV